MGNSVEGISYNCVFFSYSQRRLRAGALRGEFLPLFFEKWSNGGELTFHHSEDLVETTLLQLFTHPQHSEWFSTLSVIICEVNIVAEQKQTYWCRIFYFL